MRRTSRSRVHKPTATQTSDEGFSLIELLVALAIMALVATLATPRIIGYLDSAKVDTARSQIRNIESALDLFYIEAGRYPTEEEGLAALEIGPPSVDRWNGPYLKNASKLLDPWGKPYLYRLAAENEAVMVRSLGRDGKEGGDATDRDITN